MHRALIIPEVFRMICAELHSLNPIHDSMQQRDNNWQNRHALEALAKTCTAFQSPALDMLWADVEKVLDLMSILPIGSLVDALKWDEEGYTTEFCSAPSPSDIDHLCEYSRRIRKLTVGSRDDYYGYLAGGLLQEPVGLSAGSVFPKLRHLVIGDVADSSRPVPSQYSYPLHRPLLLPYLTTLELCLNSAREDVDVLLGVLPEACPSLQHLAVGCLDYQTGSPSILRAVSQCIPRLPSLVSLQCPDLEDDAFAQASGLPNLRELRLTELRMGSAESKCRLSHGNRTLYAFSTLATLELTLPQLSDGTALLGTFTTMPSTVKLDAEDPLSPDDVDRLFDALKTHPSGEQMQKLELGNFGSPFRHKSYLKLPTFRPLLHFHALRSLRLRFSFPDVMPTLGGLLEMAQSWPLLEELSFPSLEEQSTFSFDDVLAIAEAFPRIQELGLPYDWEHLDFKNTAGEIRERSKTLRKLRIYRIKYENLAPVCVVLACSFPSLAFVDAWTFSFMDVVHVLTGGIKKLRMDAVYGEVNRWTVDDLAKRVQPIFEDWKARDGR